MMSIVWFVIPILVGLLIWEYNSTPKIKAPKKYKNLYEKRRAKIRRVK